MPPNKTPQQAPDVTVMVPPVVCQALDPHTGIPFMPHIAAYLAGTLRRSGAVVQVLDSLGISSRRVELVGTEFMLIGEPVDAMVARVGPLVRLCFIYCRTIAEMVAVEMLVRELKRRRPEIRIVLFENIQAVTSYSLAELAREWLEKGADCILCGEPEDRVVAVARGLLAGEDLAAIPGTVSRVGNDFVRSPDAALPRDLDAMALPAWDLFDLDGYWNIGFAHAPVKRGERFLPLLTSRGCPFQCTFCIAPQLNHRWRARSAANVVDEMEHFHDTLGVTDFHVSDLNPTVRQDRIQAICREILRRNLKVTWKLAQGTKIETIKDVATLELMAQSGCVYVSFSPESGSKRVLKIMNKPFDHAHALKMAAHMRRLDIRMQAVFLAGIPGEAAADRAENIAYASRLVRAGVDEINAAIFTPLPGAKLAKSLSGYSHYSQCTFSPTWRSDYPELAAYRKKMYGNLFWQTLLHHPGKLFCILRNVLTRNFETKMEMSLFKKMKLLTMYYFPALIGVRRR